MNLPPAVDGQHHFRFRVVPAGAWVDTDCVATAHGSQNRRLGEDFGIGPDPDFQVLRPHVLLDQNLLETHRLGGAGAQVAQVVADDFLHQAAYLLGPQGIATGFFLDDPFDHAGGKRYPCRLDHLQVSGRQQEGFGRVALFTTVDQQVLDRAQRMTADFAHRL